MTNLLLALGYVAIMVLSVWLLKLRDARRERETKTSCGTLEHYTYFTKESGKHLLYQAESWVRLRLMLETTGPVAVGSSVTSAGTLLLPNVEVPFVMAKGNRIFIAAPSINRVRVIIEPTPWMGRVAAELEKNLNQK